MKGRSMRRPHITGTSRAEHSLGGLRANPARKPRCGRYTRSVDAAPLLGEVARRLNQVSLEAVLIGNAAAALQGAPVTTVDFACET